VAPAAQSVINPFHHSPRQGEKEGKERKRRGKSLSSASPHTVPRILPSRGGLQLAPRGRERERKKRKKGKGRGGPLPRRVASFPAKEGGGGGKKEKDDRTRALLYIPLHYPTLQ